jgi:hypothetical protein
MEDFQDISTKGRILTLLSFTVILSLLTKVILFLVCASLIALSSRSSSKLARRLPP